MGTRKQGVGLLGGSFDPVHNGHLSIARSFLKSEYISELWILLAPDPPHKTGQTLSGYKARLKMLQTAFTKMDDVHINEVERQLSYPSYTVQTMKHLYEKFNNVDFYLCMGEDSAANFEKWYKWEEILDYCELLVAQRPDADGSDLNKVVVEKAHFVPHQPVDLSSTEIRKRVMRGKSISSMVPAAVNEIIEKESLYKE